MRKYIYTAIVLFVLASVSYFGYTWSIASGTTIEAYRTIAAVLVFMFIGCLIAMVVSYMSRTKVKG